MSTKLPAWLLERQGEHWRGGRLVYPVGPGQNRYRTQRDEAAVRGLAVDQVMMNRAVRRKQAKR